MVREPSVERSDVESVEDYGEHKEVLRRDFWYSCAYCTRTELETRAKGFEIDHYVPISIAPELKHSYANLMWSCGWCNGKKLDLHPPEEAQREGIMFFRPDEHHELDHFTVEADGTIEGLTKCGVFTVEMLELDRDAMNKLRRLREELGTGVASMRMGIRTLRGINLDSLPVDGRMHLLRSLTAAAKMADDLEATWQQLLVNLSKSEDIDPDPAAGAGQKRRKATLDELRAQHPGKWRGREYSRDQKSERTRKTS